MINVESWGRYFLELLPCITFSNGIIHLKDAYCFLHLLINIPVDFYHSVSTIQFAIPLTIKDVLYPLYNFYKL